MEKQFEYAVKIQSALTNMFEENEEMANELTEDENATAFFHALATIVPAAFYQKFTGDEKIDNLGFNHIANRLCVQFSHHRKGKKK